MSLLNISPIDGRYSKITRRLSDYFSEFGFMKYRVEVEIKYLIFLINLLEENEDNEESVFSLEKHQLNKNELIQYISSISSNFSLSDCELIKEFETKTNHDVKAVEYFIREKLKQNGIESFNPLIHFGLTSQDINNTAVTKSLKEYIESEYIPRIDTIISKINELSNFWREIVMVTRTHGQPAVPSTLGKEFRVFSYRLEKQLNILRQTKYYGKFGGAVGNLNAHYVAFPDILWEKSLEIFLNDELGLIRDKFTTQIDNYENLAVIFDCIRRINTILIDMDRDIWQYISMEYLSQTFNENEVGSSTMPQKINPINFENSEGNLMLANNLLDFMSNKLPISRLQRDLTDSTVLRNLGSIFGYIEIAYSNFLIGIEKIQPNIKVINRDLDSNVAILTEALQVILRKHGVPDAYEIVKDMCRGKPNVTFNEYCGYIDSLDTIDYYTKATLINLTPFKYIGNSTKF
jgi:adenylosuccinate lyase